MVASGTWSPRLRGDWVAQTHIDCVRFDQTLWWTWRTSFRSGFMSTYHFGSLLCSIYIHTLYVEPFELTIPKLRWALQLAGRRPLKTTPVVWNPIGRPNPNLSRSARLAVRGQRHGLLYQRLLPHKRMDHIDFPLESFNHHLYTLKNIPLIL